MKTLDEMAPIIRENDKEKRDKAVDELTEDEVRVFLKCVLDTMHGEYRNRKPMF